MTSPVDIYPSKQDRITQVLANQLARDPDDLDTAAAHVLRAVRDDLAIAALTGKVPAHLEVEKFLNDRINKLTPAQPATTTGDTTEPGWPGSELLIPA